MGGRGRLPAQLHQQGVPGRLAGHPAGAVRRALAEHGRDRPAGRHLCALARGRAGRRPLLPLRPQVLAPRAVPLALRRRQVDYGRAARADGQRGPAQEHLRELGQPRAGRADGRPSRLRSAPAGPAGSGRAAGRLRLLRPDAAALDAGGQDQTGPEDGPRPRRLVGLRAGPRHLRGLAHRPAPPERHGRGRQGVPEGGRPGLHLRQGPHAGAFLGGQRRPQRRQDGPCLGGLPGAPTRQVRRQHDPHPLSGLRSVRCRSRHRGPGVPGQAALLRRRHEEAGHLQLPFHLLPALVRREARLRPARLRQDEEQDPLRAAVLLPAHAGDLQVVGEGPDDQHEPLHRAVVRRRPGRRHLRDQQRGQLLLLDVHAPARTSRGSA